LGALAVEFGALSLLGTQQLELSLQSVLL
jgi:hypothetical protein